MIRAAQAPADALAVAMADPRPKIRLPGDDRLLSDFAADVGALLGDKPLFRRGAEAVTVEEGRIFAMTPERLRTYVERFGVCFKVRTAGKSLVDYSATMRAEDARGCLVAGQFLERLRPLRRVAACRLPVLRDNGTLALLPEGWDAETETLTLRGPSYDEGMTPEDARAVLDDLLAEFPFADERSRAVAVAALVGLFANGLLPRRSLRPCIIYAANAEGAGKTLLASCCVVPLTGRAAVGSKAEDEAEMGKVLLTAIREGREVVLLDNVRGRLASGVLEGFLTATDYEGRKLGFNESVTGENLATVLITGNGLTVSPDIRRRSLFVELHMDAERAEDRTFRRRLDNATLLALRPRILSALWALVRAWDGHGRPAAHRSHSAFPAWADTVGGIVRVAGYACPLDTATARAAVDEDAEDMRRLVAAVAARGGALTFDDMVDMARELGAFEGLLGADGRDVGRGERRAFSHLLMRYDRRLVGRWRFVPSGTGHGRRYVAEPVKAA